MGSFDFESLIPSIPDWPKPGVVFRDITPLLASAEGFAAAIDEIAGAYRECGVTKVVGAEARGFMIAAPVALELGAGFVPARKPGKLPRETASEEFALEYGSDELHIHRDALGPDDKVLLVDDLAATGGTLAAQIRMIEKLGAELVGVACLMELEFLNPRAALAEVSDLELFSLVKVQ